MRIRALQKASSGFSPEKIAKLLDDDARHIDRLARLVDQMLDLSRISTGRLVLMREPFDLCLLIKELVERFVSSFEATGCDLTVLSQGTALGMWDRGRIEQVVLNLMTNAMKYGKGTPVVIRVTSEDGHACFVIQDEGIGVAPQDHQRIFQQFERANPSRNFQGLGLGLYISAQIVAAHQGTIGVESMLGHGATFTVRLPMDIP